MKKLIIFIFFISLVAFIGFIDPYASRIRPFTAVPSSCAENSIGYSMTLHNFYGCTNTGYKSFDLSGITTYAPIGAKYITQTADANLTNEQALSALATGVLKNTTTTGVLSIATPGTDYQVPATTIAGYGITDFNSLGDTRWLKLAGGTLTGNLLFTDNTLDIGASGATRPRTGYFGTSIIVPTLIGGSAAGSSLSLQSTSGTGSGDFIDLNLGTNGSVNVARIFHSGSGGVIGRNVDNSTLQLVGGSDTLTGQATLVLYGKSHASPNRIEIYANTFTINDGASPFTNRGTFATTTFTWLGNINSATYSTATNCSDSAGAAACGSAAAGSFVIDAAATSVTVSTTAVTANSQIFVQEDSSLGTRLGVTCNTQSILVLGPPVITARTAGTSFTISIVIGPTTNPACYSYHVIN